MEEIYSRIEELCRNRGINVTTLCRECEIPRAILTDYKKGRIKNFSVTTLSSIAKYFEVSLEYLYSGKAPQLSDDAVKVALFGGDTFVTEEMWTEVKRYAQYVKERENGNH